MVACSPGRNAKSKTDTIAAAAARARRVPNTKRNKVASLVHDGLCQLLREGLLPAEMRDEVDLEFRDVLINSGTWLLVAQCYYLAVREFGEKVIFSRAQRVEEAF